MVRISLDFTVFHCSDLNAVSWATDEIRCVKEEDTIEHAYNVKSWDDEGSGVFLI